MTTPTVPQDIYLRHEREWQLLRQAIANSERSNSDKTPDLSGLGREDDASKDLHQ
ncbi:MAG: hypothetical protein ACRECY_13120 [Phyllobacterium sp.]